MTLVFDSICDISLICDTWICINFWYLSFNQFVKLVTLDFAAVCDIWIITAITFIAWEIEGYSVLFESFNFYHGWDILLYDTKICHLIFEWLNWDWDVQNILRKERWACKSWHLCLLLRHFYCDTVSQILWHLEKSVTNPPLDCMGFFSKNVCQNILRGPLTSGWACDIWIILRVGRLNGGGPRAPSARCFL